EPLEDRLTPSSLGVTFDDGSGHLDELPLLGYSWGGAGAGKAGLQNFTLTLATTSAEPGLWGHLAAGSHINSATIHVRTRDLNAEYLTYTLTGVTITSFSASGDGFGSASHDTVQLTCAAVNESSREFDNYNQPGPLTSVQYNFATGQGRRSGAFPSSGSTQPL